MVFLFHQMKSIHLFWFSTYDLVKNTTLQFRLNKTIKLKPSCGDSLSTVFLTKSTSTLYHTKILINDYLKSYSMKFTQSVGFLIDSVRNHYQISVVFFPSNTKVLIHFGFLLTNLKNI